MTTRQVLQALEDCPCIEFADGQASSQGVWLADLEREVRRGYVDRTETLEDTSYQLSNAGERQLTILKARG